MNEQLYRNDENHQDTIAIPQETMLKILNEGTADRGDMIALLTVFGYYAQWLPNITAHQVSKCLGWGVRRLKKTKLALQELGLLDDIGANFHRSLKFK